MSDSGSTTTASLTDLVAALAPDPERPASLSSTWTYASLHEGTVETGVWEATVDTWTEDDYPVEEVCLMLGGHLRLTDADGTVHDLRAGDAFHLPRGWAGTWEVIEDMRKFYVVVP